MDSGNPVAAVKAHSRNESTLSQRVELRSGVRELVLNFRYRASPDYSGRGFRLLFERPDSSYTYWDIRAPSGADWKNRTITFTDLKLARSLILRIEVRPGEGTLYFDDFVLTAQ